MRNHFLSKKFKCKTKKLYKQNFFKKIVINKQVTGKITIEVCRCSILKYRKKGDTMRGLFIVYSVYEYCNDGNGYKTPISYYMCIDLNGVKNKCTITLLFYLYIKYYSNKYNLNNFTFNLKL